AIRKSDAIVVLTQRANDQLRKSVNYSSNISIDTIPCCVDLQLFKLADNQNLKDEIGLSDKFVFVYSGSVGTYNLLDEMFDFFKEALN
ncbi:MAG: hypothetical protein Q8O36_07605, partial [Candidatus Omnitrophota bacterium]|nr:hypothetical protein [Candidatus Omnitrophota bacterium]